MRATRRDQSAEAAADLSAQEAQTAADADETEAAARYRRGRAISPLLAEAVRRADAFSRLDAALGLAQPHR
jgi:hypothetical protein